MYFNIAETDALVILQITISTGRSSEIKKSLFQQIAELLAQESGLRQEDVLINLIEMAKENRSFGNGEARYAT